VTPSDQKLHGVTVTGRPGGALGVFGGLLPPGGGT